MDSRKVQQIIENASSCLKDSRKYRSNSRTKISLLTNPREKNYKHFSARLGDNNNNNNSHSLASSVSHTPTIISEGLYKILKNKDQEPQDLYMVSSSDEKQQQVTPFEKLKKRNPYSSTVVHDDFLRGDYDTTDNSAPREKFTGAKHQIVIPKYNRKIYYNDSRFNRPFPNANTNQSTSDRLSTQVERLEMQQRIKQTRLKKKDRKSSYHEIHDLPFTFCHEEKLNINKRKNHIIASGRERPKTTQNYSTSSNPSCVPASGRSIKDYKERVEQYNEKASTTSYSHPNSMRHRHTAFSSQDLRQFCSNFNNKDSSSCSSNCNSTRKIQIKNIHNVNQLQRSDNNSEPQIRTYNQSNISNEPVLNHLLIHNSYKNNDENVDNCFFHHYNHTEENNDTDRGSNKNYRQNKRSSNGIYSPSSSSSYCGSDMVDSSKDYPNAITYLRLEGLLQEDYEFLRRHKHHIEVPQYARHPVSLSPSQKHVKKNIIRHGPDSNYY